jgi:hypothetical protein
VRKIWLVMGVVVLAALSLAVGCSMTGGDDPEPDPTGTSAPDPSGSSEAPDEGPTTEDLSAELFAASQAQVDAEPVGSATAAIPSAAGAELTVDVLAVTRNEASTTVQLRLTGTDGTLLNGRDPWYDSVRNRGEARTLYLVDPTVSKSRYLPLSFDQAQQIAGVQCACPDLVIHLGETEEVLVTATYPPLPPETTTVDLVANDGWLTVSGLPVGD